MGGTPSEGIGPIPVFLDLFLSNMCGSPPPSKVLHLLFEAGRLRRAGAPAGADRVASEEAVLVLGQPRQGHEEDPLLGPAGLGGDGKDLRGYEAGFVAGDGFFPPNSDEGST